MVLTRHILEHSLKNLHPIQSASHYSKQSTSSTVLLPPMNMAHTPPYCQSLVIRSRMHIHWTRISSRKFPRGRHQVCHTPLLFRNPSVSSQWIVFSFHCTTKLYSDLVISTVSYFGRYLITLSLASRLSSFVSLTHTHHWTMELGYGWLGSHLPISGGRHESELSLTHNCVRAVSWVSPSGSLQDSSRRQ